MAIATSRCTQATAIKFLSSLRERRARKRRCIAGGYPEGIRIPGRSTQTRVGAKSLSTGTSTELDTHGQEATLLAPTLIRRDRTPRGECCGSSSSIRFHSSEVSGRIAGQVGLTNERDSRYWARNGHADSVAQCPLLGAKRKTFA